jgi:hypothetical protein
MAWVRVRARVRDRARVPARARVRVRARVRARVIAANSIVRLLLFEQHGVELLVGLNDQKLHGEEVRVLELLRDLGHLCVYASIRMGAHSIEW